jgi:hypothetical protein
MRRVSILLFILFGFVYSIYLALEGGFFTGFAIFTITLGLAATIYILDRKASSRIIIYVWIAIIVVIVVAYISTGVFETANIFKNPVKYI